MPKTFPCPACSTRGCCAAPLPHARVRGIDTSAAEALPGVRAILHAKNCDVIWSSGDHHGRRRLFADTARFVGERWPPWPPWTGIPRRRRWG